MPLLNYSSPIELAPNRPTSPTTSLGITVIASPIPLRSPVPERRREPAVAGLGHYIDVRLSSQRFRID